MLVELGKLVTAIVHPSPTTVSPALREGGNFATGDDVQTQPKRTMSLVVFWMVASSKYLCWFSEFNV